MLPHLIITVLLLTWCCLFDLAFNQHESPCIHCRLPGLVCIIAQLRYKWPKAVNLYSEEIIVWIRVEPWFLQLHAVYTYTYP